jgi:integrase
MRAFCNWLEAEGYVEVAPSNRVKMPKVGKPLIRIIEFEEFERILKACTPPHEIGPITDMNAARNRAIFWVLWDTGIHLAELCDPRLSNFDRHKGVIIVHGKGNKERRIALQGQLQDRDLRTIQRRFLRATGLTQSSARQMERARYATYLLRQGVSILDTALEAGYFDQPHLTRSLKYLIGQTPAQIREQSRPEQMPFLYKTTPFG